MNAQLTPRMLVIDALSIVVAFPLVWLALTLARWDPTFHMMLGWWLFAVVIYCLARIVQIVVYLDRTRAAGPPVQEQDAEFFDKYPEFAGDRSTDRLGIVEDVPKRRFNWFLLINAFIVQLLLSVFRILPYLPFASAFGLSARYLNTHQLHIFYPLSALMTVAGWLAVWFVWVATFRNTYKRIDRTMTNLFWSIWPW